MDKKSYWKKRCKKNNKKMQELISKGEFLEKSPYRNIRKNNRLKSTHHLGTLCLDDFITEEEKTVKEQLKNSEIGYLWFYKNDPDKLKYVSKYVEVKTMQEGQTIDAIKNTDNFEAFIGDGKHYLVENIEVSIKDGLLFNNIITPEMILKQIN